MTETIIYFTEDSAVFRKAAEAMQNLGLCVTNTFSPEATHILLPIPQSTLPANLPITNQTIIGGNLNDSQHKCMDLLKDEWYLSKNAMITAHIAVTLSAQQLPIVLEECPVLILGWGRIGKCLMQLLRNLGADVTVAARKPSDLGMIAALGCQSTNIHNLTPHGFRLIFNTVPYPVLDTNQCRADCVKIELASAPGITGPNVIQARGLPGKYAPESSGKLIAQTIHRLLQHEEVPV